MAVAAFAYTKILASYSAGPQPGAVRRSDMESGEPKQAPRFSRVLQQHNMKYLLTAAQYTSFITWWKSTANFGTAWFDYYNPITASTEDGRMVSGEYSVEPFSATLSHYVVSMTVESWL